MVENQIAIILCGTRGFLTDVPVNKVKEFENDFIELLQVKYKKELQTLKEGKLTDEVTKTLEKVALEVAEKFKQ